MNKSALVAAGVVAAACAAYVGAAVVGGQKVEKALRAVPVAAQAQWPMVKVTEERYDRGLFTATHTVTLRVGCDAAAAAASAPQASITVVQHVKHGPFPGFAGFGAATVDTELALDKGTRQELVKFTGTEQPLRVHTDVAFDGATHTHLTIASFRSPDATGPQVAFQGLTGDIDSDVHAIEYDLRAPGLSVAEAASAPVAMRMSFKGAHVHARAEGAGELALRAGKSQGELESAEVDFVSAPDTGGTPHKLAFNQLRFSQDTAIDKGLMNTVARADGHGQVDDTKLDKIEMQATMKRFDAAAYQGVVRRMVASDPATCGRKAPDPAQLFASQDVQAALLRMLSANPEFSLDRLAVEVGGKRAELGYLIGVNGFTADDAKLPLPAGLMARGYGSARIKLPADWIQQAMTYVAQQSGQSSDIGDRAAMVELMLGKAIDGGYVVREDDMLRSELAFRNGRATINGKPLGGPAEAGAGVTPL
ncbi:MAG: YdgA family protein [Burkholderiaceae bacterium]